jgi:SAM-dependent methyltransferase
MLDGRLEAYIAVDPQRTELVDVMAVGERLPFAEAAFDVVLCSQMLCYAEDTSKVIDEIYCVLRPGGTLLLSVPAILPYHAENDSWRFSPGALRLLLSRFSRVDVSPEGYSLLGACHVVALFLDSFAENWVLRKLVASTLIPFVNLAGERLDNWSRPNTSFSNSFFASAQK